MKVFEKVPQVVITISSINKTTTDGTKLKRFVFKSFGLFVLCMSVTFYTEDSYFETFGAVLFIVI